MHKTIEEAERICSARKRVMEMFEAELSEGKEYVACHAECIGAIVDMIKDLAEAGEKVMKEQYYETVIKAMEDYDDPEAYERRGYDNWRYKSGRFAPKGRGTDVGHGSHLRMGYDMPWPDYVYPYLPMDMYHDEIGADGMMHHDPHRRMGYPMDDMRRTMDHMDHSERGLMYDEYKMAKKHYTQTHDEKDAHHMNAKILEKSMETLDTMGEMWQDANPEIRKQMKHDVMQLLEAWEKNK